MHIDPPMHDNVTTESTTTDSPTPLTTDREEHQQGPAARPHDSGDDLREVGSEDVDGAKQVIGDDAADDESHAIDSAEGAATDDADVHLAVADDADVHADV